MSKKKKYIAVKNKLPELLEAVCYHKDCPRWLKNTIWDKFNNQTATLNFTAAHWRSMLNSIEVSGLLDGDE
jgi:hypothetical protein